MVFNDPMEVYVCKFVDIFECLHVLDITLKLQSHEHKFMCIDVYSMYKIYKCDTHEII